MPATTRKTPDAAPSSSTPPWRGGPSPRSAPATRSRPAKLLSRLTAAGSRCSTRRRTPSTPRDTRHPLGPSWRCWCARWAARMTSRLRSAPRAPPRSSAPTRASRRQPTRSEVSSNDGRHEFTAWLPGRERRSGDGRAYDRVCRCVLQPTADTPLPCFVPSPFHASHCTPADSRLYGGVHFKSSNVDGLKLGRLVASKAFDRIQPAGKGNRRMRA